MDTNTTIEQTKWPGKVEYGQEGMQEKEKYGVFYEDPHSEGSGGTKINFATKKDAKNCRSQINSLNPDYKARVVKLVKFTAWYKWKLHHWYPFVERVWKFFGIE